MATSIEITGHVVKDPRKVGDVILLNVPMKPGDILRINGWDITLPTTLTEDRQAIALVESISQDKE